MYRNNGIQNVQTVSHTHTQMYTYVIKNQVGTIKNNRIKDSMNVIGTLVTSEVRRTAREIVIR